MFCVIQSFIEDVPVYKCIVAIRRMCVVLCWCECEMVELADGVIHAMYLLLIAGT